MKTLTIDHKNGNSTTYQLIENGHDLPIAYHAETSPLVVAALERARKANWRVKIYLGDTKTGVDWLEENDTTGYIGLSKGYQAMFPILVSNKRSMGGGRILDHCILKIRQSKGDYVMYQASNYQNPQVSIRISKEDGYAFETFVNDELYGRHKTLRQAKLCKSRIA